MSSPVRHLPSQKVAGDSVVEVGGGGLSELACPASRWGRQCCPPASVSKENSWDSKSDPAQPEDSASLAFVSPLHLSPQDKASGENEPEFLGEESFRSRLIFKVKFLPFIIY